MAEKTATGSTPDVSILDPEQASTNFYWTYQTKAGRFNLQTTIRGILSFDQIKAHIASVLEATAHVDDLGGQAKPIGKQPDEDKPGEELPKPDEVDNIIAETVKNDPALQPEMPAEQEAFTFVTEKLDCTITKGKKYFKVKGGKYNKFGVTVWPEVLASVGISEAKLEAKEYNMPGYTATYIVNADDQPVKVTKLVQNK